MVLCLVYDCFSLSYAIQTLLSFVIFELKVDVYCGIYLLRLSCVEPFIVAYRHTHTRHILSYRNNNYNLIFLLFYSVNLMVTVGSTK